jgi:hypothetical protein
MSMSTYRIQKDVDALKRIADALIDRMENIEQALAISKGATGIKVQKASATNSWTPKGSLARLEKSATAKAAKPEEGSTVGAAVRNALEGV